MLWFGQSFGEDSTAVVLEPGQGGRPWDVFTPERGKSPLLKRRFYRVEGKGYLKALSLFVCEKQASSWAF